MKVTGALALLFVPAALAHPTAAAASSNNKLAARQSEATKEAITDKLLFQTTLPDFITARDNQDPSYLDWTSDACTDSPDNPLGFPFKPACQHHDFGYRNYKAQSRFTVSNKLAIDNNFLRDLKGQCSTTSQVTICDALADVYYAAVRAFGGEASPDAKRDDDLVRAYQEAVDNYNALVEAAGLDAKISA